MAVPPHPRHDRAVAWRPKGDDRYDPTDAYRWLLAGLLDPDKPHAFGVDTAEVLLGEGHAEAAPSMLVPVPKRLR